MKKIFFILMIVFFNVKSFSMDIRVYFSPNGGCLKAILREIHNSRKNIKIMAYRFTSGAMIKAIAAAKNRGVAIEAVLDGVRTRDRYSRHEDLKNAGAMVYLDYSVKHMHDKVMIIDNSIVVTGSYNFTTLAERGNSENLLVIRNSNIYRRYLMHFYQRKQKSRRL